MPIAHGLLAVVFLFTVSGTLRAQPRSEPQLPAALAGIDTLIAGGRHDEARAALAQAREDADRRNLRQLAWQIRIRQARLERDAVPVLAARYFGEALDILDDARGPVLAEQLRGGALSRTFSADDPYELAINFWLDHDNVLDAFFVAERGRARRSLDTLRGVGDVIARDLPQDYLHAEATLLARVSEAKSALRIPRLDASRREALNDAIRTDEEALNALRLRLAAERPAIAAIRYPLLYNARDLQRKTLRPNQALIAFSLGEKQSASWVVEPDAVRTTRLPARADIETAVRRYLEQVRRPGTSEEPQRAAALFSLLLPGFSVPDAITELIIIPDGILTDLPFEALRDRSGRRVIERFSISYAPSASTYALLVSREPRSRTDSTLLALGNPVVDGRGAGSQVGRDVDAEHASLLSPLRYAAAQMQGLARAYGPAARVLEGPAATEAALRADLSGVSTLHLATRGIVDEGQPGRSRLILTAAADDDGVLQMRELFALRLNRALVTLPAVETAVAVNTRSEGLGGLSRAWFYAGADTVVTSLWTVDARTTPRLMTDFYEAMARGLPAAEALRQAKLRLMNGSAGGTDPFSWAAFVTIGNGAWTGAPPQAPSRWPLIAGAAAAAAAGAAVPAIWWARRRRTSASHS